MKSLLLPLLTTAACFSCAAVAGDSATGRQKATQSCALCHGQVGVASAPETPNLAGEPVGYISRQLRAFRSGKRQHEVMNVVAKPLTDEEIDNLAAWFSSIKVTAVAP